MRASKSARNASIASGCGEVDPGGPRVGGVDAEPDPRRRHAPRRHGLGDVGQLGDVHPEPEPAARRVLEDDHGGVGPVVDLGEDERQAIGQPGRAGGDTGAPVRADVDVDEPTGEARRRAQVAGEDRHRRPKNASSRPGEVDQVRRVDRDGPDVELAAGGRGRPLCSAGGSTRRRHAVGLSTEDLECAGADLVGSIDGLDHAVAERKVGAEASSIGKHPRHRTTPSPWAMHGLDAAGAARRP